MATLTLTQNNDKKKGTAQADSIMVDQSGVLVYRLQWRPVALVPLDEIESENGYERVTEFV